MSDSYREPTPAELRALMVEADALQRRILDVHARLQASPDREVRGVKFRLEDAAGLVRDVRGDLDATAGDLARVRAVQDGSVCAVPWGVCPDHGSTLQGSGGRAWCTEPGCARKWTYDRLGSPCGEPLVVKVTDSFGTSFSACQGHGLAAHKSLDGAALTPLDDKDGA